MDTTTTTNTTTTTININDNDANDAQPPQPQRKERKPKWMRAPTPFEKQRGARLILEAAGRLRPRRRVVAAVEADGAVAEVEAAVAAVALVAEAEEEEEADNNEERAAWRAMLALNRRLRAPPVVAAILRLFPLLVAQARRQAPDTHRDDGVKYDMTALPDAFVLAQHPHCFVRRRSGGSGSSGEGEEEALHSAHMMVDASATLAETFEVLLNEFRLRPRRRHHQHDDAPIEGRELLLQIRAYQDAFAAAVVSKRAAAPTRASSSSAA